MAVDIAIKTKPVKIAEIPIPPGLAIPEGLEEGEVFDFTGSYRIGPGGGLQTVAIEGIEIPTGPEKVAEEDDDEIEEESVARDGLMDGLTEMLG